LIPATISRLLLSLPARPIGDEMVVARDPTLATGTVLNLPAVNCPLLDRGEPKHMSREGQVPFFGA
jgi:hypothetical protein